MELVECMEKPESGPGRPKPGSRALTGLGLMGFLLPALVGVIAVLLGA